MIKCLSGRKLVSNGRSDPNADVNVVQNLAVLDRTFDSSITITLL